MTRLIFVLIAFLCGCAAFEENAGFPEEQYFGDTPFERLLSKVNKEANYARPCRLLSRCQADLPAREELARTVFVDSKGYVMKKAYALQDAGVDESRMRVATFELFRFLHYVLVVDGRYVLDNFHSPVRELGDYERFNPVVQPIPHSLMAR
jgi:predicted transglutaminase-like cysteine proteinase